MKNYLTAHISAAAIRHNIQLIRDRVGKTVRICPVVKDDCYGHGMDVLYPVLADCVDGFVVAAPLEALALRRRGYKGFVLCLLSAYFDQLDVQDELVRQSITQTVMSKTALASIRAAAERVEVPAQVHLKVDSGMGRLGVPLGQAKALISLISELSDLKLTGIYTHFATADEADKTRALKQLEQFKAILPNDQNILIHASNSAATIDLPDAYFGMVRLGVALYGYQPSEMLKNKLPLQPCMTVNAKLIALKHMPKGSCSGYGLEHCYVRDSRVGIVPIGYGDGYFRNLSGKSVVRVHGKEAPVCGRVSMDQITVDVTDIPEATVGDQVEVISSNPLAQNSVENLARLAGTIPYEITCHLGHNIRHVLV
jgi:alanine racemase